MQRGDTMYEYTKAQIERDAKRLMREVRKTHKGAIYQGWTLGIGDPGLQSLTVKFRDAGGNESNYSMAI